MSVRVYIMAGGAGTRLRPLSQTGAGKLPKQFLPVLGGKTLLEQTIQRIPPGNRIVVIPERCYSDVVTDQAKRAGADAVELLEEPFGCNTAAALISAAAHTVYVKREPQQVIALVPADHMMDSRVFSRLFSQAGKAAEGYDGVITLGITPTRADTNYGYIQVKAKPSGEGDGLLPVSRFVEKPDEATAEKYLQEGSYFWNAGLFFGKAEVFLSLAREHCPDIALPIISAMGQGSGSLDGAYRQILEGSLNRSIDYALMEHIPQSMKLLPAPEELKWNDLGSWEALAPYLESDGTGNSWLKESKPVMAASRDTMVCNYTEIPVQIEGADGMIVVVTNDGILLRKRTI